MTRPKVIKMKIFQNVQKNLAFIGYSENQRPFKNRQLIFAFLSAWSIMAQFIYLFCIADTQKEFMEALFMTVASILIYISFLSTVLEMKTIFLLIDVVEKLINKSELFILSTFETSTEFFKTLYERTNQLAEKCSEIVYFLIVSVSVPGFVLPKAILSYFLYFTTDLGSEAFETPIPIW